VKQAAAYFVADPVFGCELVTNVDKDGYGRVGHVIGDELSERGVPFLVIEERTNALEQARALGVETLAGNAADAAVLAAANIAGARWLFVAIPNEFEAGQVVEQANDLNPDLSIVAWAHSDDEVAYLRKLGADSIIMGEREIARGMIAVAFPEEEEEDAPAPKVVEGEVLPPA